jgi:hypothetical protein
MGGRHFRRSKVTIEGAQQHQRVDKDGKGLPPAGELPDDLKTRAITLSFEIHSVIAKIDLLEAHEGIVTPVDYKRGRPRESAETLEMWPSDRVQLALKAIILRENGYNCKEVIAYTRPPSRGFALRWMTSSFPKPSPPSGTPGPLPLRHPAAPSGRLTQVPRLLPCRHLPARRNQRAPSRSD